MTKTEMMPGTTSEEEIENRFQGVRGIVALQRLLLVRGRGARASEHSSRDITVHGIRGRVRTDQECLRDKNPVLGKVPSSS